MYNNDIYSRLLAGESMEDIMEDLTAQANEAQDRYNEFRRLEEERLRLEAAERKIREDAEREAKHAAKRDHLVDLISELLYFIAEHYPAFGITTAEVDDTSDETLNALADLAIMALDMEAAKKARQPFHATMKLGPMNFPFHAPKATLSDTKSNTMEDAKAADPITKMGLEPTADDVFASFFKNFM